MAGENFSTQGEWTDWIRERFEDIANGAYGEAAEELDDSYIEDCHFAIDFLTAIPGQVMDRFMDLPIDMIDRDFAESITAFKTLPQLSPVLASDDEWFASYDRLNAYWNEALVLIEEQGSVHPTRPELVTLVPLAPNGRPNVNALGSRENYEAEMDRIDAVFNELAMSYYNFVQGLFDYHEFIYNLIVFSNEKLQMEYDEVTEPHRFEAAAQDLKEAYISEYSLIQDLDFEHLSESEDLTERERYDLGLMRAFVTLLPADSIYQFIFGDYTMRNIPGQISADFDVFVRECDISDVTSTDLAEAFAAFYADISQLVDIMKRYNYDNGTDDSFSLIPVLDSGATDWDLYMENEQLFDDAIKDFFASRYRISANYRHLIETCFRVASEISGDLGTNRMFDERLGFWMGQSEPFEGIEFARFGAIVGGVLNAIDVLQNGGEWQGEDRDGIVIAAVMAALPVKSMETWLNGPNMLKMKSSTLSLIHVFVQMYDGNMFVTQNETLAFILETIYAAAYTILELYNEASSAGTDAEGEEIVSAFPLNNYGRPDWRRFENSDLPFEMLDRCYEARRQIVSAFYALAEVASGVHSLGGCDGERTYGRADMRHYFNGRD